MLSLNAVSLEIENTIIFQNISLTLLPSSITYIQGPNGSGKTSLLRIISGIQNASSGKVSFGKTPYHISDMRKPFCTYVGHNFALKQELTILDHLTFWAKLYNSIELINASLAYFNLTEYANQMVYELSAGNQKKVALARLMICRTKLWLLDEIDTNLDQHNQTLLNNLIISHANNGGIILITSHNDIKIKTSQKINISDFS